MLIHQSDLSSFNRCGEQHRRQLNGTRGPQLSATAYGSVLHHALHTLERTGDVKLAVDTFDHYWHPLHIDAVCEPVQEWIARDSYGALRTKGMELIKRYFDLVRYRDEEELLALEMPFVVPILDTWDEEEGRAHYLGGTIDRLALRFKQRRLEVCIDDWKSGRKKAHLPLAIQFTAYSYASTQPDFWTGSEDFYTEGFGPERGLELFERLAGAPRHGWWIDVSGTTPKWTDAGVRTDRDYARFKRAVDNYVAARKADIFPLAYEGEVCAYCPFKNDCPEGISS